jgi:hypothetical protein
MHNCRETKERLTELVLDGRSDEVSAAELNNCVECRAEFDALNATLRMTTRVSETAAPAESYWNGYHARLREKLAVIGPTPSHAKTPRRGEKLGPLFATMLCVRTSVPLPVAVAIVITCVALTAFAMRRTEQPFASPMVVHVPVEVPVVQEKIVTRVVYRDRRSTSRASRSEVNDARAESTFAKSRKFPADEMPASLNGFKPTEEVKLVVIKGGTPYEK